MNTLVELFNALSVQTKVGVVVAIATVAIVSKFAFAKTKREPALNPQIFKKFKLREKQIITHNTRLYRFDLHDPEILLDSLLVSTCL